MLSMNCPQCGLINRREAVLCDCGYDFVTPYILHKVNGIIEVVHDSIRTKRRENGLSPLFNTDTLGVAAMELSQTIAQTEHPDIDAIVSDYRKRALELGYPGLGISASYCRNVWPLVVYDGDVVNEILGYATSAQANYWEDYGLGLLKSSATTYPGQFGMCVVIGLGYTDGNALVVNYINEERKRAGVRPLEIDRRLRAISRSYLGMSTAAVPEQVNADIRQYRYLEPGYTVRYYYGGAYTPYPVNRVSTGMTISEIARLVADKLVGEYREVLLRPDWQHIGVAVNTRGEVPPTEPRVLSFTAEYVVGWRLEADAERPECFPPPLEAEPTSDDSRTPTRKRRWWPFR